MQIDRSSWQLLSGPALAANGNLFAEISTNGVAGLIDGRGFDGYVLLCLQKTGTGTCTVTPQGSFDGTTFYSLGFQNTDAQATLTRTVTAISVTGGSFNHVYQLLDFYPFYQFAVSATAGVVAVTPYLVLAPL